MSLRCSAHHLRTLHSAYVGVRATLSSCESRPWGVRKTVAASSKYGDAGIVMKDLNSLGIRRKDAQRTVKHCVEQGVACVLGASATVQLQGSAAKGSSIPRSDWDFFVRLHTPGDTVTWKERKNICKCLAAHLDQQGIEYLQRLGRNRVRLYAGSDYLGVLPDADLVFERYKRIPKIPPNNRALANHVTQQVVKYIKYLPYIKTHLPAPKSSLVEIQVVDICKQLREAGCEIIRTRGFDTLLYEVLSMIAGSSHGKKLNLVFAEDRLSPS